jgi:uncharacterized protein YneF (UPF0154 family)
MDDRTSMLIALLVILSILLGVIIIFGVCWCVRRRRRYAQLQDSPPSEESSLLHRLSEPRIQKAQTQENSSLLTCHFYIRTTGEYTFHSQLSQLGSDPEKSWFLITPISKTSSISLNTASHILTIQPKSDRLNHLNDEDSTATYIRTLNNLFSRLFHPYVEPIIKLDILYTQKLLVTVKQYQRLGSLKDLLHGVTPTANFHVLFFSISTRMFFFYFRVNIHIEVKVYHLNVFDYILVNYLKLYFFFNQNHYHQLWIYIVEISLYQVHVFK